jgi:Trk-type K+ transport system membrane component
MDRIRGSEYVFFLWFRKAHICIAACYQDIGLPAFEALPVGTRVVTGLFQGVAARASGFQIVSIAALAPALQYVFCLLVEQVGLCNSC